MAIILVGSQIPAHPEEFERKLQAYDKDLLVVWHKPPTWKRSRPGVWKIEMCVAHHSGLSHSDGRPKHTHVCQRSYVMMVQDEQGTPLPLGDHVIEKLRSMRAYSESFGGQTERGLKNFIQHSDAIDAELENKRAVAREDIMQHNRRFNRVTLNRAYNLLEQHDLRPNK